MVCTLSLLAAAAVLKQASSWTPPVRKRISLTPRQALTVEQDARWPGWTESVDPAAKLLYMPFLETHSKSSTSWELSSGRTPCGRIYA